MPLNSRGELKHYLSTVSHHIMQPLLISIFDSEKHEKILKVSFLT